MAQPQINDEEILALSKEITKLELSEIMYADECQKAFNLAIVYLSYRMRAEEEIRTYLKQKEMGQAVIDEVVHRLHRQKYLDDQEFANAYVRTQVNGGKKGPNVIKQELKQKKIDDTYITEALTFYPEAKQIEHAIQLGEKLVKQQKKLSERILKPISFWGDLFNTTLPIFIYIQIVMFVLAVKNQFKR